MKYFTYSILIWILFYGFLTFAQGQKIDWIYQVDSLLMPYWMMDEALGNPPGNFPNNRYDDGNVINPANFDFNSIYAQAAPFILGPTDSLRRDFIRMKARQVYAYCIAFNLTGNEDYLIRAKLGLDFLIKNGAYKNKSVVTFWQNGKALPGIDQRNVPDIAYGLLAPTAYYYITRDLEILNLILKIKRNVWKQYYEESEMYEKSKLMMWVKEDFENDSTHQKNLLAPLDMLNAHLMLMTSSVPDSLLGEFISNIKELAYSIKENFYSEKYNIFWGNINSRKINGDITDFAHSIKSFWMLYIAAGFTSDDSLKSFAEQGARKLLNTAFIKEKKRWASQYIDSTLAIDEKIFWWAFAELDQMTATLSYKDSTLYSKYLAYTYPYWQKQMIDHEYKEVFWGRESNEDVIELGFKVGVFKSGYHSLEHALIGYLSTSNYYGDDMTLYYVFDKSKIPDIKRVNPYYYKAEIVNIEESDFESAQFKGQLKMKVTFKNIK